MKTSKGIILIFTGLLLAGCAAGGALATSTVAPTRTATATESPTQEPTKTPFPTRMPSATPIAHIDVPAWLGDPESSVLVKVDGEYRGGIYTFNFINAESGERFELAGQTNVGGYFWMPNGRYFGMIDFENRRLTFLDLITGDIEQITPPPDTFRLVDGNSNKSLRNYFAFGTSPADDKLIITGRLYENDDKDRFVSSDGTYIVLSSHTNEGIFEIEEISTGKRIRLLKDNELEDSNFSWSPKLSILAVGLSDKTLRIYNIESQELLRTYSNAHNPTWSPNGEWVLYNRPSYYHETHWVIPRENYPCISNVFSGSTNCLSFLIDLHPGLYLGGYQWAPNSQSLTYLFYDNELREGGICITSLIAFEVSCPTKTFGELYQQAIYDYILSPNGKYIVMRYSENTGPGPDNTGLLEYAVLSLETNTFRTLGHVALLDAATLWRPPITD